MAPDVEFKYPMKPIDIRMRPKEWRFLSYNARNGESFKSKVSDK